MLPLADSFITSSRTESNMTQRSPPISHCFSAGWFGIVVLTALRGKRFYKDTQAPVIGSRLFTLTRPCDIQRLLVSQSRYHIFKTHDGCTIQVMNDAVRLSIFPCAFKCEIGTARAIF